jgi:arylsulfatase A-like enzyme
VSRRAGSLAVSLAAVYLVARTLALFDRGLPASPWMPLAFLWQDLLVAGVFGVLELWRGRSAVLWIAYGALSLLAAIDVPVMRVLSTPITWPMLRAARGTLADSMLHHLSAAAGLQVGLVLALAAGLPIVLGTMKARALAIALAAAVPLIILGAVGASRMDTEGLHRNSAVALIESALPRISAREGHRPWRESPLPDPTAASGQDLSRLRGAAAGGDVLVMVLESAGAGYLAPYGAAEDPMPHVTELARRAILFEHAYSAYPESIKGLFSTLCSLWPAMDVPVETHARVASPTLASRLRDLGYRTALFHSGRFMYLGMDGVIKDRGFEVLEDAGDIGGERDSSFGIDETSAVKRILRYIDSLAAGERFFIAYLPVAGHHPYQTASPGPFSEREEIGRYRNALHEADAALGDLLAGLESRGRADGTLLAVFGDHGEAFHQHPGNYGHTFHLFEENVHVPLLFALPGSVSGGARAGSGPAAGIRIPRAASLIDVAPTVLDLLGAPIPAEFQGRSLLGPQARMALFFTDYSMGRLGLADGRWKCILEVESGRSKLFDLAADPGESNDLAERFPERVQAYRDHLLAWSAAQMKLLNARATR